MTKYIPGTDIEEKPVDPEALARGTEIEMRALLRKGPMEESWARKNAEGIAWFNLQANPARYSATWKEEEHPRDEGGEFVEKGQGDTSPTAPTPPKVDEPADSGTENASDEGFTQAPKTKRKVVFDFSINGAAGLAAWIASKEIVSRLMEHEYFTKEVTDPSNLQKVLRSKWSKMLLAGMAFKIVGSILGGLARKGVKSVSEEAVHDFSGQTVATAAELHDQLKPGEKADVIFQSKLHMRLPVGERKHAIEATLSAIFGEENVRVTVDGDIVRCTVRRPKDEPTPRETKFTDRSTPQMSVRPEDQGSFDQWFGDSKLVDKDGKPMTLYHGTDTAFTEYGGGGELSEMGWHYFSDDPKFAGKFATSQEPLPKEEPKEKIKVGTAQKGKRKLAEMDGFQTPTPGLVIARYDNDYREPYMVTHEATGLGLSSFERYEDAIDFVNELPSVTGDDVDWTVPGAKEVMAQVKRPKQVMALARDIKERALNQSWGFGYKGSDQIGVGSQMQPVHVRMENPLDLRALRAKNVSPNMLISELAKHGIELSPSDLPYAGRDLYQMLNQPDVVKKIRDQAIENGHDGIIFKDLYDDRNRGHSYVAFESDQIKSASGNRGSYDRENRDTRFSVRSPEFKHWFGNSKVVDAQGKPQVVYHGTGDVFSEFDLEHPNRMDTGWLGEGVYATTNVNTANAYATLKRGSEENVIPMYMRIENPYHATIEDKRRLQVISHRDVEEGRRAGKAWTEELKAQGHDGIILPYTASDVGKNNEGLELVAFEPNQVKSATGNAGSYDPESNDIRFGTRENDLYQQKPDHLVVCTKYGMHWAHRSVYKCAEWKEADHPRGEGGRFVDKGTGTKLSVRDEGESREFDPDSLSKSVLNRIDKRLKKMGYDSRGAEDVREALKTRGLMRDGKLWHEDWIEAYDAAVSGDKAQVERRESKQDATSHVDWGRVKQLGYTTDPREGGYLAPNGKMIDLSGVREGGSRGMRSYDHREVGNSGSGTSGMQELIAQGYIRMDGNSGFFDIGKRPEGSQRIALRKLIEEFDGEVVIEARQGLGIWDERDEWYHESSDDRFYKEYDAGTKASKIMADIDRYYGEPQFSRRSSDDHLDDKAKARREKNVQKRIDKYLKKAKEIFGHTDNDRDVGYVLPDGTALNFHRTGESATPIDHGEIGDAVGSYVNAINTFMKVTGAMRVDLSSDSFRYAHTQRPLTGPQKRWLQNAMQDDKSIYWDTEEDSGEALTQNELGKFFRAAQAIDEEPQFMAREHKDTDRKAAAATARGGPIGSRSVVAREVEKHLRSNGSKKSKVLDFGAGHGSQAEELRSKGYDVTAYDFKAGSDLHEPNVLDKEYDLVYASKVLNVQQSKKMLASTVKEIGESVKPGGVAIVNLPQPLKGAYEGMTERQARDHVEGLLEKHIGRIDRLKASSGTVWKVHRPRKRKYAMGRDPVRYALSPADKLAIGIAVEIKQGAIHRSQAKEIAEMNLRNNPHYYDAYEMSLYSNSWAAQPVRYEQRHAPKPDGVTINGKHYTPGQFIPGDVYAEATPMQQRQIDSGQGAKMPEKPRPATQKDTVHDTNFGVRWPWQSEPSYILKRLQAQNMLRHATMRREGERIVVEMPGDREIGIRIAEPGELERMWRESPEAAQESVQAGGIIKPGSIAGAYRGGEIILAADFTDAELNHELVHALQDLDIISDREIAQFGGFEEMAYAYQRWIEAGRPRNGLFQRISDFFSALLGSRKAKNRQFMRKLDKGNILRTPGSGERGHLGMYMLAATAGATGATLAWGAMHKPKDTIGHGDVDPRVPESGMRTDGSIAAGSIVFATRDWEQWWQNFNDDPDMQAIYSQEDRQDLYEAMQATARIFGNFGMLDEEHIDTEKLGPIRPNSDPLFNETFDLSTICPNQDQFVAICNQLQAEGKHIFGKEGRHLINKMIQELGGTPYCAYCYGQTVRNAAAESADKIVSGIWPRWVTAMQDPKFQKLMARKPGDAARNKALNKVFGTYTHTGKVTQADRKAGDRRRLGTPKNSVLLEAMLENWQDPSVHELARNPSDVHNIILGYKDAQGNEYKLTPGQKAWTDKVRLNIQGGIKPNMPKGWESYRTQVLRKQQSVIDKYNASAGFRMNSQTDFRPWHTLEVAQFLAHLHTKGGMAHAYTRSEEFVKIFGDTGIKFNLSCAYAHDANGNVIKSAGKPQWDMLSFGVNNDPHFKAPPGYDNRQKGLYYRQLYPDNVGTMLVATSMDALMTGLSDPDIDMMIPYHAGTVPKAIDVYEGWVDFTDFQHEQWTGYSKNDKATYVAKLGPNDVVELKAHQPITREHHHNDKQRYLDICDAFGIVPRFPHLVGRGHQWQPSAKSDMSHPMHQVNIDHPGYMKLVRDVAANPSNQQAVDPRKINWPQAEWHVNEWVEKQKKKPDRTPDPALVQSIRDWVNDKYIPLSPMGQDKPGIEQKRNILKLEHKV